jgi:hypothetical protein
MCLVGMLEIKKVVSVSVEPFKMAEKLLQVRLQRWIKGHA